LQAGVSDQKSFLIFVLAIIIKRIQKELPVVIWYFISLSAVMRIWIRCIFDPRIRDPERKKIQIWDPGSGIYNPEHIYGNFVSIFWIKNT
jgi:hypothetical protein